MAIDRRTFIKRLGMTVALVACSPAADETTTTTGGVTTTGAATSTTDSAGETTTSVTSNVQPATARVVIGSSPPATEGNNPQRDYIADDVFQLRPMYENLIGVDPETGAWIPELAESWSVEPDGMSLRLHLRQGVQFHNDFGEFTAADVRACWLDLIEPEGSIAGAATPLRDEVEDVEIVGDYELVFRMKVASYSLYDYLSGGTAGMDIKSKADYDSRGLQPGQSPSLEDAPIAGTGPYQFVERVPGQYIRFARVPYDHWRVNPDFPELELRWIPENSTRLAALLAGEIHVANLPQDLLEEAVSGGAEIVEAQIAGRQIAFNLMGAYALERESAERLYPESPINDMRVRQAINKAIDRDAINQAFYGGEGEPNYLQYFHPNLPGWDPQFEERFDEMYGFDPEAARALLAEAGYGPDNPCPVNVVIREDAGAPELPDVMEAVAGMMQDVGFVAEIETYDLATFRQNRRELLFNSHVDFNDSSSETVTAFIVTGTSIFTNRGQAVEIPEIDAAYKLVLQELDDEAREPLWREIGRLSYENFQHVPVVGTRRQLVVDPAVVADYVFPGRQLAFLFSHFEYIKAVI